MFLECLDDAVADVEALDDVFEALGRYRGQVVDLVFYFLLDRVESMVDPCSRPLSKTDRLPALTSNAQLAVDCSDHEPHLDAFRVG